MNQRRVQCKHCGRVRRVFCKRLCLTCYRTVGKDYPKASRTKDGRRRGGCGVPLCGECKKNNVNRPRGLCWGCYYRPGVREKYPSTHKCGHRGVSAGIFPAKPPAPPVRHAPYSLEMFAERERRAALGLPIKSPGDGPETWEEPLEWRSLDHLEE